MHNKAKHLLSLFGFAGQPWFVDHAIRGFNNGHSKYMPHQGAAECERRRKRMRTGEFAPGTVK